MVLLPLHLTAFLLLYLGAMRIVRGEILRTHTHDAHVILDEALHDLHPLMVSHDAAVARESLELFMASHELLDLRLYDPSGMLVSDRGRGGAADAEVVEFLASGEHERFRFRREGGSLTLHGLTRLDSQASCQECHPEQAVLGVASMRLDMTPQVEAAHDRMGRSLALLMVAWAVLVALINVVAGRFTRRSLARLKDGIGSAGEPAASDSTMGKLLLDPVSARLYESLRQTLERQQQRDVELSSRLHHTERLASLGQLAAGLAHEIKNPLAGIRGVLELLRDEEQDGDRRNLYREMLDELDRVNGTIQTLLGFARPSPPRRVPTSVGELVGGIAKLMRPGLAKKGIALETTISPELRAFPLDPNQIRQVVVNLVSNAADAIERDGTIAIRATTFPDGTGLILAVEDDGPGIPDDRRHEIFEPFYSTKFSGTGLGLAVARSLVAKHGGELQVESRDGKGSVFFALLPEPETTSDHGPRRTE
jgi:signal transduction histidine kinase